MQRTDVDRLRRRSLASASALAPPQVILYLHAPGDRGHDLTMARLRRYAGARDWPVVAEITDRSAAGVPLVQRPEWGRMERLIVQGIAEGIVTPHLDPVRFLDGPLTLRQWLDIRHAFLEVMEPGR